MGDKRAVTLLKSLVGLWVFLCLASFLVPLAIEPTGSGFSRGANRLTPFLGFQLLGFPVAIACCLLAMRYRPILSKAWKWAGFGPILFLGLLLAAFLTALLLA